MQYLAVLGRERALSLAELESVTGSVQPFGGCALISPRLDINRLGGSLKLARIIDKKPWQGWDKLQIDSKLLPTREGKTVFGVSFYGPKNGGGAKKWALELKKQLKTGGSVRVVVADTALSAAQLKFNQVLDKGFEVIVAVHDGQAILALTEQYQDIDWYSRRDYDRPARSAKVGMLPPKLAQIMVNLAGADKVYDPFCGTGVVLAEALLMGKAAGGSDLEPKMVDATLQNLEWLGRQVQHRLPEHTVAQADARTVKLPPGYSVVSEGYLGPPLSKIPAGSELAGLKADLTELYVACLKSWHHQLGSGQAISLAVPCWQNVGKFETLPLIDQIGKIGYTLVRFQNADSRQLFYARPDQIVGRQLLVLQPK